MNGDGPVGRGGGGTAGIAAPGGGEGADVLDSRSLEAKILVASLVILAGIAISGRYGMLPGAACGAAIASGNFYLIRKILGKAFSAAEGIRKGFVVRYVLKFLALVAAVYLVVRSGRFDLLGFLLGLSALVFGVLLEGISRAVETR